MNLCKSVDIYGVNAAGVIQRRRITYRKNDNEKNLEKLRKEE